VSLSALGIIDIQRGVSKGIRNGQRPPALRHKVASEVARQQGIEGSGMAGPSKTLAFLC
jgi:hypothetical protein